MDQIVVTVCSLNGHSSENHCGDQGFTARGLVETRERLLTPGEVANLFRVDPRRLPVGRGRPDRQHSYAGGAPQVPRVRGPSPVDGEVVKCRMHRCALRSAAPRRHRRPERQYHLGAILAPTELAGPGANRLCSTRKTSSILAGDVDGVLTSRAPA